MTPDALYEPLNKLREEYRRAMNAAAAKACEFAAAEEMDRVSEHSTESSRKQEAFLALNRALNIVERHFIEVAADRACARIL